MHDYAEDDCPLCDGKGRADRYFQNSFSTGLADLQRCVLEALD